MSMAAAMVNAVRLMTRDRLLDSSLDRILFLGERFFSLVWTG